MKKLEKPSLKLSLIYGFLHLNYKVRLQVSRFLESLECDLGNRVTARPSVFGKGISLIPVFFGCLGSLVFCALLSFHSPALQSELSDLLYAQTEINHIAVIEVEEKRAGKIEDYHLFSWNRAERRDIIQELYRDPESQERVIDFFAEISPSRKIAEVILSNADSYDIAPALAFALAWEESRLNPRAVNSRNRNGSIDRGLFQLNNYTFPRLEIQSFFDSDLNAQHGMSHLRFCLDTGVSEVAALAIYNAGTGRVRGTGTPKTTLDYAGRILENRWEIENRFREREAWFQEQLEIQPEESVIIEIADAKPVRRFVSLKPLGIRN